MACGIPRVDTCMACGIEVWRAGACMACTLPLSCWCCSGCHYGLSSMVCLSLLLCVCAGGRTPSSVGTTTMTSWSRLLVCWAVNRCMSTLPSTVWSWTHRWVLGAYPGHVRVNWFRLEPCTPHEGG
jgi:hypothetical protein